MFEKKILSSEKKKLLGFKPQTTQKKTTITVTTYARVKTLYIGDGHPTLNTTSL